MPQSGLITVNLSSANQPVDNDQSPAPDDRIGHAHSPDQPTCSRLWLPMKIQSFTQSPQPMDNHLVNDLSQPHVSASHPGVDSLGARRGTLQPDPAQKDSFSHPKKAPQPYDYNPSETASEPADGSFGLILRGYHGQARF